MLVSVIAKYVGITFVATVRLEFLSTSFFAGAIPAKLRMLV